MRALREAYGLRESILFGIIDIYDFSTIQDLSLKNKCKISRSECSRGGGGTSRVGMTQ